MGIPAMRWVGLGIGLLGVAAWAIGVLQSGLIPNLVLLGWLPVDALHLYMAYVKFALTLSAWLFDAAALQHNQDVAGLLLFLARVPQDSGWGMVILVAGVALIFLSASIIRKY